MARDLAWLPEPAADFRVACRALAPDDPAAGQRLQGLATARIDSMQTAVLARAARRIFGAGGATAPLARCRLAILANHSIEPVLDELLVGLLRHGVAADLFLSPYDQAMQEALDPGSATCRSGADIALLALDHRWFGFEEGLAPDSAAALAAARARLERVVAGLQANAGASLVLQTIPVPPEPLFGGLDRAVAGSRRALIEAMNRAIFEIAKASAAVVLDVAALVERVGALRWFDPARWNLYKLPFAADCAPLYAEELGRLVGALRGKARKALVLDLDNTLWGGVVGDDGVAGLTIGPGSAAGEAFHALQTYALAMRERGVFLAVASKNNDETAREPFRSHPDMALRLEHISVFQANWTDKAANLEAIARHLNIGVDALVFVDDNPAERAFVRASLPAVAVPEMPTDPTFYARTLAMAGYFEAVAFSDEDRLRSQSQAAEARRAELMASARDVGDYLSSLGMRLTVAPFDPLGRPRIAQLINKSNQFNLTTRRYTEFDVGAMERDPSLVTIQARLADRFSDFGMIGVIIARPSKEGGVSALLIDAWLMSCRVLGRKVEQAMLGELARAARARGVELLVGEYRPTPKNNMVAGHYDALGFALTETGPDGAKRYRLAVDDVVADAPIAIERPGGAEPAIAAQ